MTDDARELAGAESQGPGDGAPPSASPSPMRPPGLPPAYLPRSRQGSVLAWVAGLVSMALIGTIIAAAVVRLPYYALRPGETRDVGEVVSIEGVPTYETDGAPNFTTVSIGQVTLLEMIRANLDGDMEVVHEDVILGDRNAEENRQLNLNLMHSSQDAASYAALDVLGYDVSVGGDYVVDVQEGFPAEGEIAAGDVILEVNGETVDQPDTVFDALRDKEPGDMVEVVVAPAEDLEDRRTVELELAADPDDESRGIMGVLLAPIDVSYDSSIDIQFDTGEVGGPSAGLAFTLTIIDLMTEGDLTGDLDVAVTGTIRLDGSVGSVGGTAQKAAAARGSDMDLFLVPSEGQDYDNAVPHAGDDMDVVKVDDIEDALEVLEDHGGDPVELPEAD